MDEPIVAEPIAEPTSVVNADGSFAENWSEKYGEENQAHLSRYKDIDSLVNSHISTKKKFGKNPDTMIEMPTETSSDEVKEAWRKANGVPDNLDSYEYTMPDDLAIKLGPLDDTKMGAFKEFANKQGWSAKQFADTLDFYHNNMAGDIDTFGEALTEQQNAASQAGMAELKKDWLSDTDNRIRRAQLVMEKYGGVDAVEELNLQNSPTLIRFLDNIAGSMSEDTLKGVGAASVVTASNIKSQINDLRIEMDKIRTDNPVNYKANSKYKELTERKHVLYKQFPS